MREVEEARKKPWDVVARCRDCDAPLFGDDWMYCQVCRLRRGIGRRRYRRAKEMRDA